MRFRDSRFLFLSKIACVMVGEYIYIYEYIINSIIRNWCSTSNIKIKNFIIICTIFCLRNSRAASQSSLYLPHSGLFFWFVEVVVCFDSRGGGISLAFEFLSDKLTAFCLIYSSTLTREGGNWRKNKVNRVDIYIYIYIYI